MPWDRRRPAVQSFRGGVVGFEVAEELVERLGELGREEGATLFMVLLAGIQVLLARWSGEQDIVVGTPIAGRAHQQTEEVVGFFVNMLAMRTDVSGGPGFREVVKRVKEVTLSAYEHQDLPFEKVVEALQPERDLSRQPLFQVAFTLQNSPQEALEIPGLQVSPANVSSVSAKFDLLISLEPGEGGLRGSIEYSTDVFERGTIERVGERLLLLLEGAVREPEKSVEELELLGEVERRLVVEEWNRTLREYPAKCVHELFEEQARRTPEAVAVEQGEERLSYGELEARSNQLARYLVSMGVGPEVVVGLCVERSVETVVGILGVLKAGGAYLPLDASYPAERLSYMLRDARACGVVTQSSLTASVPGSFSGWRVRLDEDWGRIGKRSRKRVKSGASAENLAYVMYTSGSTGTPKGVGVVHRNIVRLIDPVEIHRQDVMLQLAPVTFDASTFEIWGALLHGATLVLAGERPDLAELPELIQSKSISVLWLTAGLFHQMVDDRVSALAGVRMLLAGGDALSVSHVRQARKVIEGSLINGYGPTECTTFSTWHEVKGLGEEATTVPIGAPIWRTRRCMCWT